ncbi:MAG: putative membrane protein (TIGR00267 family) [Paraglaciecola sp.]|jgi:predicted membrane protein (TIGR00267 family)
MKLFKKTLFLLGLTSSKEIVRRYFVVNGFDGALTMLGLILGFLLNNPTNLSMVMNVCLGAAIALGMSGVSSAYVSEYAERQHALGKLENAMIRDLQDSAHGKAARWTPIIVALVNGSAPLLISLLILSPLWASAAGLSSPLQPLHSAIIIAMLLIFLLGVFLGRIAGISWLRSGIQTLLVATITAMLIYLFAG